MYLIFSLSSSLSVSSLYTLSTTVVSSDLIQPNDHIVPKAKAALTPYSYSHCGFSNYSWHRAVIVKLIGVPIMKRPLKFTDESKDTAFPVGHIVCSYIQSRTRERHLPNGGLHLRGDVQGNPALDHGEKKGILARCK